MEYIKNLMKILANSGIYPGLSIKVWEIVFFDILLIIILVNNHLNLFKIKVQYLIGNNIIYTSKFTRNILTKKILNQNYIIFCKLDFI